MKSIKKFISRLFKNKENSDDGLKYLIWHINRGNRFSTINSLEEMIVYIKNEFEGTEYIKQRETKLKD